MGCGVIKATLLPVFFHWRIGLLIWIGGGILPTIICRGLQNFNDYR